MGFSDEERWLEAERRIAPQVSSARRRASRRAWLVVLCAAVAYGLISGLLRALLSAGDGPVSGPARALPATLWIGLVLSGAGAVLVLGGLVAGLVTKRLRPTWERVDGALTRRQRSAVRRRIRGVEPVSEQRRAVVRAIAEQDVRTAIGLVPCYLGTALMVAGLMLSLDLPEITALVAALFVLLAAAAIWQYGFTLRAARAYLAAD